MRTADQLFDEAFTRPRNQNSDAYKAGVKDLLRVMVDKKPARECPYEKGTAEFDAYWFGVLEGDRIATNARYFDQRKRS